MRRRSLDSLPLRAAFAGLALPLALAGCAVGPDFTKPAASVPEAWHGAGDQRLALQPETDSQWWKSLADPTLDRLIELAYQQNLPLQIAGLRILEARAQLGVATGQQFPQIQTVSGTAAYSGISANSPSYFPGLPRHFGDYQVGFDAAWELDFWGKYRRGVESEAAGLQASVADYYAALVSLTAEVARTYVLIRTDQVLIANTETNAQLQEESFTIAQARFKNGATSELDPTQASTLLESTRATIPELQTGLTQAENALSTLLGQPAGSAGALLAGPKEIPKTPEKIAVAVPAEMLRRRPDIHSAELNAAAQCARVGVAKSDLYPSFSLFGTVGLETSTVNSTTHNLFSSNSLFFAVGPRISWPFFNYGRLRNGVRVQDARFEELLVAYRNTVLRAVQEVEDALAGFLNARESMASQQKAVASAQRAAEIALAMYREGATDYQRVIDAQRSLLTQQNSLVQASSSVTTNLVALYKALGGGWEARQGQPFVPADLENEMRQRTNWGDLLTQPRKQEAAANPSSEKP
ncbi:MAG TPA: efflux transporter outer membrane subunit [Polyangia bacterium]|nr:efflux transporter outer membrane subunit [Polyangia bacterium]